MKLNTFLNFGGNCEDALRFYEQHLGGRITMLMRRSEQPAHVEGRVLDAPRVDLDHDLQASLGSS